MTAFSRLDLLLRPLSLSLKSLLHFISENNPSRTRLYLAIRYETFSIFLKDYPSRSRFLSNLSRPKGGDSCLPTRTDKRVFTHLFTSVYCNNLWQPAIYSVNIKQLRVLVTKSTIDVFDREHLGLVSRDGDYSLRLDGWLKCATNLLTISLTISAPHLSIITLAFADAPQ